MIEIFWAGGPIMLPLLLCSVITLGVITERALYWWRVAASRRTEVVSTFARQGGHVDPETLAEVSKDPVGRVLAAAVQGPAAQANWRMRLAATEQLSAMTRYLVILNTMVALAPLLGIFGTVLGIIQSFQLLGEAALADPIAASRGLAQALITTAFGLAIAMPSLIAYKYFHSRALEFQQALDAHGPELESSLRPVDGAPPGTDRPAWREPQQG